MLLMPVPNKCSRYVFGYVSRRLYLILLLIFDNRTVQYMSPLCYLFARCRVLYYPANRRSVKRERERIRRSSVSSGRSSHGTVTTVISTLHIGYPIFSSSVSIDVLLLGVVRSFTQWEIFLHLLTRTAFVTAFLKHSYTNDSRSCLAGHAVPVTSYCFISWLFSSHFQFYYEFISEYNYNEQQQQQPPIITLCDRSINQSIIIIIYYKYNIM